MKKKFSGVLLSVAVIFGAIFVPGTVGASGAAARGSGALESICTSAVGVNGDGLSGEARTNRPATMGGNWRWRMTKEQMSESVCERIRRLTTIGGRLP